VSRVTGMKRDTALKIAASTAGVPVDTAKALIAAYFESVALCPLCAGSRRVAYRQRVQLPVETNNRLDDHAFTKPGTDSECPNCGPEGHGDPDWVAWVCYSGDPYGRCQRDRPKPDTGHERCGWAIAIPLKDPASV